MILGMSLLNCCLKKNCHAQLEPHHESVSEVLVTVNQLLLSPGAVCIGPGWAACGGEESGQCGSGALPWKGSPPREETWHILSHPSALLGFELGSDRKSDLGAPCREVGRGSDPRSSSPQSWVCGWVLSVSEPPLLYTV